MWKKGNDLDESKDISQERIERPSSPRSSGVRSKTAAPTQSVIKTQNKTVICEKSSVTGDITGKSDVIIAGAFQGKINIPEFTVTIDTSGRAKASVNAAKIVVRGTIIGDLQAVELVHVPATGTVRGDIRAGNIVLERGCTINGSIEMPEKVRKQAAQAKKPGEVRPSPTKPAIRRESSENPTGAAVKQVAGAQRSIKMTKPYA